MLPLVLVVLIDLKKRLPRYYARRGWFRHDSPRTLAREVVGEWAIRKAHELATAGVAVEMVRALEMPLRRMADGAPPPSAHPEPFTEAQRILISSAIRDAASTHRALVQWMDDVIESVNDTAELGALTAHVRAVKKRLAAIYAARRLGGS